MRFERVRRGLYRVVARVLRRSLTTHGSIATRDVGLASAFYSRLGYREVTATRGAEVVLLRNDRGHELNLIVRRSALEPAKVSLPIEDLDQALHDLGMAPADVRLRADALGRRARVTDPDGNELELIEPRRQATSAPHGLYLVVTATELRDGLSAHFFMPPEAERRFVAAPSGSAFIELLAAKLAKTTEDDVLIVVIDTGRVSIEDEWHDDPVQAMRRQRARYPRVLRPVDRAALVFVGIIDRDGDDSVWPSAFVPFDEFMGDHV